MIQLLAAMLMFTFFALAGLVVDLGFVRLAQRQMNTPTDAASLEGLRLRDTLPEADRRAAAREILRMHFDDDFGSTATDAYQYGAGPDVTFVGGTGALAANQRPVVGSAIVYEPDPQLNLANLLQGDMVAGWFDASDLLHAEDGAYRRSDFGLAPQGASDEEAFLVRLRRTNDPAGLDGQAGVSSHGPTLPYLFSRGSLLAGPLRRRGITVRSTSVAAARRVTLAGVPQPSLGMTGTTPFLLEYDYWAGLAPGATFDLSFTPETTGGGANPPGGPPMINPNPTQGGPPIIPPGQLTTTTLEPVAVFADRYDEDRRAWSIGDPVWVDLNFDEQLVLDRLGNPEQAGYTPTRFLVPIYEGDVLWFYDGRPGNSNPPFLPPVNNVPKDDMDPRVVGFGLVEVVRSDEVTTTSDVNGVPVTTTNRRLVVRKLPGRVWPTNVSAVETPGLAGLPAWLAEQLLALNRGVDQGLTAAALVR
jgi:hypothetical protein